MKEEHKEQNKRLNQQKKRNKKKNRKNKSYSIDSNAPKEYLPQDASWSQEVLQ